MNLVSEMEQAFESFKREFEKFERATFLLIVLSHSPLSTLLCTYDHLSIYVNSLYCFDFNKVISALYFFFIYILC